MLHSYKAVVIGRVEIFHIKYGCVTPILYMGKMECQEDKDLLVIIQMVVAKCPKSWSGTQTNRQHCLS